MKKILYPTDFSDTANNAFIYALDMAEKLDAEIIALHVYHLPDIKRLKKLPSTLTEVYNDIEFEEFENFRDAIPVLRKIAEENNKTHVKVSHLLVKGEAVPTISRVARKENVDFVIMGTKGATGLKELFMGSTTSGVIQKVKNVIISVPKIAKFDGAIDQIVFLTNFKKQDARALRDLKNFAGQFPECHIHCLHFASSGDDKSEAKMKDLKRRSKIDSEHVIFKTIHTRNTSMALSDYCTEHQIDIVALLPRKPNLWQKITSSSFSLKMAHHLEVPLMTLSHYTPID